MSSSLLSCSRHSKSKSYYDRRSVGQSVLVSSPIWGPRPEFCYCQTFAGLLMWDVFSDERAGLSFIIAAGLRQRSNFRVRVPRDSWPNFTVSDSKLPQHWRPGHRIFIPQEQGGPVIPPGTGFHFRRLLWLTGLGGDIRTRLHTGASLLATNYWITVGRRQRSDLTILYSQFKDSRNLESLVIVFISPSNRVAQLYPQALGFLSVASYDSQGYGRSCRCRLSPPYISSARTA
jgi:hypothetical protein